MYLSRFDRLGRRQCSPRRAATQVSTIPARAIAASLGLEIDQANQLSDHARVACFGNRYAPRDIHCHRLGKGGAAYQPLSRPRSAQGGCEATSLPYCINPRNEQALVASFYTPGGRPGPPAPSRPPCFQNSLAELNLNTAFRVFPRLHDPAGLGTMTFFAIRRHHGNIMRVYTASSGDVVFEVCRGLDLS